MSTDPVFELPVSELVVSLVGRPNVGKSTLFNVLTKSRDALVADYPGLTRDRQYGRFQFKSVDIIIIDTGGLSGETEELASHMEKQTRLAVDESDIILFMVDARDGLTPADEVIADSLRRTGKHVKLILNKTDGLDTRTVSSEFFSLGLGEPLSIAASQNRGIQLMLSNALKTFNVNENIAGENAANVDEADKSETEIDSGVEGSDDAGDKRIKVAIIGRPNVGKSTLFNRLIEQRKAIVDETAGVTRDRNYGKGEWIGVEYSVIDTGGYVVNSEDVFESEINKQVHLAIDEADVIMFVVDVEAGITDLDDAIASILRRNKKENIGVAHTVDNNKRIVDAQKF